MPATTVRKTTLSKSNKSAKSSNPAKRQIWYEVSERQRDAVRYMRDNNIADIHDGIQLLTKGGYNPQIETFGVHDQTTKVAIYDNLMTPEVITDIDQLMAKLGVRSRSIIVRSGIEALIHKHGLTQYKKPENWEPRPLVSRQMAGAPTPGNPVEEQELISVFVPLPEWLAELLEPFRGERNKGRMSHFARWAIDNHRKTLSLPSDVSPALISEQSESEELPFQFRVTIDQEAKLLQVAKTLGLYATRKSNGVYPLDARQALAVVFYYADTGKAIEEISETFGMP